MRSTLDGAALVFQHDAGLGPIRLIMRGLEHLGRPLLHRLNFLRPGLGRIGGRVRWDVGILQTQAGQG
jgi:hypothetical protein